MYRVSTSLAYVAVLLVPLVFFPVTTHAAPQNELQDPFKRYDNIGHIEAVDQMRRTITMRGKEYKLAAGITIAGMGEKNKYNIKVIAPGMQIGYKLIYKSTDTISELWIMPE